jgi:carbonic anhydrase
VAELADLFANNRAWAAEQVARDPGFFAGLAEHHAPEFLWTVVEDAWSRGQDLTVHGLVYGLEDGLLRDLGVTQSRTTE